MPTGEYKRTVTGRKHQSEAAKKRTPKGKEAQPGCKRNLIPAAMAKLMNMTPEEWGAAMVRSRTVKKAIQTSLVEAALKADPPSLYTQAIKTRDSELMDLLERGLKIIGAAASNPTTANMINIEQGDPGSDGRRPVVVKFVDAKEEPEEPEAIDAK